MRWDPRPARLMPTPRPSRAVTIGRPIAMNEPKVISKTTIAASSPIAVAEPSDGLWACSIAWPPSATCSDERSALTVRSRSHGRSPATGSVRACSSKVTVANATRVIGARSDAPLSRVGAEHGDDMGQRATRPVLAAIRAMHRRSVIDPCEVANTIWSWSPACCGKSRVSSIRPRACDCVPGSVRLLEKFEPAPLKSAIAATRTTSQPSSTRPRCRVVQTATRATAPTDRSRRARCGHRSDSSRCRWYGRRRKALTPSAGCTTITILFI